MKNTIKNIKFLILLLISSNIYAEIIPPLIISEDNTTIVPIAIDDNKLYLINTKAELEIISDINIPNIIEKLAKRNAESLISENSPLDGYKATRKGKNKKGYVFISDSTVSIINGISPDKRMDKRLNINITDRLDELGLYEVTYDIYRKDIETTLNFEYPSNILTLSIPDKSILNNINNGMMFRTFGPFISTEDEWIKEKYYTISHPEANMEIISITPNGNSGFSSIKNIKYKPLAHNNKITLYNTEDIKRYNVFTGSSKRKHSIINNELNITSLESSEAQNIIIRGAVPQKKYKITVQIEYKGGELNIDNSIKNIKNYKINNQGYNKIEYNYINNEIITSNVPILKISIPPKGTLKIRNLSIIANKIEN